MNCSSSDTTPSCHVEGNKIYIKFKRSAPNAAPHAGEFTETAKKKPKKLKSLPICQGCGTGQLHGLALCAKCDGKFEDVQVEAGSKMDFRFSTLILKAYKKLMVLKSNPVEFFSNPQSPDMNVSFDDCQLKELMYAFDKLTTDGTCFHLSIMCGMTVTEIYSHLLNIRAEHFHNYFRSLVQRLVAHPMNRSIFNTPVDPIALNIPTYHTVISHPMDLGTVKTKLQKFQYDGLEDFSTDVRLVFSNAILFNPPNHFVTHSAKALSEEFETEILKISEKIARDDRRVDQHKCPKCAGQSCGFCGEKCLRLEPPLVTCTASCRSRIKRAAHYYVSSEGLIWCQKCYGSISSHKSRTVDGTSSNSSDIDIQKKDLVKRIHDSEIHEEWVQCKLCRRNFHEICAMFNCRMRSKADAFQCAFCQISKIYTDFSASHFGQVSRRRDSTAAIPSSELSAFIQMKVHQRLKDLGHGSVCDSVKVRVVSSIKRTFAVQNELKQFFVDAPEELTYNSKCVMMFQEIDGIDVCLFSMYVQEYGNWTHESNKNLVYIAYLDSVEFFRPRPVRTDVYHEVVTSYLAWAGSHGFSKAYIWACPPQRGNSFIFWCHPFHQRTPSKERLLKWYGSIVERASSLGVVKDSNNLFEEHFRKLCLSTKPHYTERKIKCPPIFDGDFWVEQIIRVSERQQKSLRNSNSSPLAICQKIVQKLMVNKDAAAFNAPVDVAALNIPDYLEIIKKPMDLGTVANNLASQQYETVHDFAKDMHLVFSNAMLYNPPGHIIHQFAIKLKRIFDKELRSFSWKLKFDDAMDPDFLALSLEPKPKQNSAQSNPSLETKVQSIIHQLAKSVESMKDDFLVLTLTDANLYYQPLTFRAPSDSISESLRFSSLMDNRQFFLEVCQHNNYQFDTLRRAKFSSMMIIYHLAHVEEKPIKFVRCLGCGMTMPPSAPSHCSSCSGNPVMKMDKN